MEDAMVVMKIVSYIVMNDGHVLGQLLKRDGNIWPLSEVHCYLISIACTTPSMIYSLLRVLSFLRIKSPIKRIMITNLLFKLE